MTTFPPAARIAKHPVAVALQNISRGQEPEIARELMEAADLIEQLASPDHAGKMLEVEAMMVRVNTELPSGFASFQVLPIEELNARRAVYTASLSYLGSLQEAGRLRERAERYDKAVDVLKVAAGDRMAFPE